jgi:exosortase
MSTDEILSAAWARASFAARGCIAALAGFALLLSLHLWPAWTGNPDLSHGILMPVAFLLLLREARAGPGRYLAAGWSAGLTLVFALTGLAVLALAGLYASVLDWSHALVDFALSGALTLFLAAGIAVLAEKRVRLMPFNWAAGVAAGLWVVCAPMPPGFYSRLTLGLQLWISADVVHTLHLLGIAAGQAGNVIRLARTSVGVEEACSGVRSLVSCVFCGILFSAILVRRPRARLAVIAISAPLALGMNFLRSLALTLLANSGRPIAGPWHDAAGFAVLGVTAALLGAFALWLGRPSGRARPGESTGAPGTPQPPGFPGNGAARSPVRGDLLLAALLSAAAALLVFFYANTRTPVNRDRRPPDLWAVIPESAPGWAVRTDTTLYRFSDTLKTDLLAQRTYERPSGAGLLQVTLYAAYWRPGQAPVSLVASHTPDACWPGIGWVPGPAADARREPPSIGGRPLAGAESRYFTNQGFPQYVWFWHLYDGRPIPYEDPYSLWRLLAIAWHYGFRHSGEQLFVRVSSNRPWSSLEEEPLVHDFFDRLRPLGFLPGVPLTPGPQRLPASPG